MVRSKQVAKKTAVTNYSFESEQSRRGGGKVYKKRVVVPNPTPKSSVARGLKVLKEIRRLQGSTQLLIPRKRFMAAVRSVAEKFRVGVRFQFMALLCIQEAAEQYVTQLFEDSNMLAHHGGRVTVMPRDISLAYLMRGDQVRYGGLSKPRF